MKKQKFCPACEQSNIVYDKIGVEGRHYYCNVCREHLDYMELDSYKGQTNRFCLGIKLNIKKEKRK